MSRRPVKKIKRKSRVVKTANSESAVERQTRSAVQNITTNPHYHSIIKAIQQGVPNSKIAEHFIARGVFEMNQKTAVGYLQYFRKARPNLCRPQAPSEDKPASYDHFFDGNSSIIHEETELLKLIELQKSRLAMGFNSEREINLLMTSTRREVKELRELLMDLAKLRGLWGNSMEVNLNGYSEGVKDDLKGIQQDESQRNMIATLVSDLASVPVGA